MPCLIHWNVVLMIQKEVGAVRRFSGGNRMLRITTLSFALAVLALVTSHGHAQGTGEPVKITTIDGVDLHGNFFAGARAGAPTVIMLAPIGQTSEKESWMSLAKFLQKGYTVLTFDYRGHGKSKTLSDEKTFWSIPFNAKHVKGRPTDVSIDQKNFSKAYQPALCNDISAVKAFLDRKNDQRQCNTASTVLIAAESGATLGALWLNSDWHRYKLVPNPMNPFLPPIPHATPEGKDVVACIWLSVKTELGGKTVTVSNMLEMPGRVGFTPMTFMYGDGDAKGKSTATALEKYLRRGFKDKEPKLKFTGVTSVKGTKLTGMSLLEPGLGTDKAIMDYLDLVTLSKGNEWYEREFRKTSFLWKTSRGTIMLKTNQEAVNLNFDTYERFISGKQ